MAQKRMFDNAIINTDKFMDMPLSAKALYFLLGMEADDYGFVSPRRVMKLHSNTDDDLKILIAKQYVIYFQSGVVVITDWKKNNWLDKRRTKQTEFTEELKLLETFENKYILSGAKQVLSECLESIEENSIVEKSIEQNSIYTEIIDYLNNKTNSNYRYNGKKTKDLIKARLNEGFNLEDFKQVIDNKVNSWGNDEKMVKFLRPETLFSNKFESYLNEKVALKKLDAIDQVFQEWKEKGEI